MTAIGRLIPQDFQAMRSMVHLAVAHPSVGVAEPAEYTAGIQREIDELEAGTRFTVSPELHGLITHPVLAQTLGPETHLRWLATTVGGMVRPFGATPTGFATLFDPTQAAIDPEAPLFKTLIEEGIQSIEQIDTALSLIARLSPQFGAVIVEVYRRSSNIKIEVRDDVPNSFATKLPRRHLDRNSVFKRRVVIKKGDPLLALIHELVHALPKQELPEPLRSAPYTEVSPGMKFDEMAHIIQKSIGQEEALAFGAEAILFADAREQGADIGVGDIGDQTSLMTEYLAFYGQNFDALAKRITSPQSYYAKKAMIDGVRLSLGIKFGFLDQSLDPLEMIPGLVIRTKGPDGAVMESIDWKVAYEYLLKYTDMIPELKGKTSMELAQVMITRAVTTLATRQVDSMEQLAFELLVEEIGRAIDGPTKKERSDSLAAKLGPQQRLRPKPKPPTIARIDPAQTTTENTGRKVEIVANYLQYLEYLRAENHTEGKSYFSAVLDLAERSPDPVSCSLYGGLLILAYEQGKETPSFLLDLARSFVKSGYHEEAAGLLEDYIGVLEARYKFGPKEMQDLAEVCEDLAPVQAGQVLAKALEQFHPFRGVSTYKITQVFGKIDQTSSGWFSFDDSEEAAIADWVAQHFPDISQPEFIEFVAGLVASKAKLHYPVIDEKTLSRFREFVQSCLTKDLPRVLGITQKLAKISRRFSEQGLDILFLQAKIDSYHAIVEQALPAFWSLTGNVLVPESEIEAKVWERRNENLLSKEALSMIREELSRVPDSYCEALLVHPDYFARGLELLEGRGAYEEVLLIFRNNWKKATKTLSPAQQIVYLEHWLAMAKAIGERSIAKPHFEFLDVAFVQRSDLAHIDNFFAKKADAWPAKASHAHQTRRYLDEVLMIAEKCLEHDAPELVTYGQALISALPKDMQRVFAPFPRGLSTSYWPGVDGLKMIETAQPASYAIEGACVWAEKDLSGAKEKLEEAVGLWLSESGNGPDADIFFHEQKRDLYIRLAMLLAQYGLWAEAHRLAEFYGQNLKTLRTWYEDQRASQQKTRLPVQAHLDRLKKRDSEIDVINEVLGIHETLTSGQPQKALAALEYWQGQIETEIRSGRSYFSAESIEGAARLVSFLPGWQARSETLFRLAIEKYTMGFYGAVPSEKWGMNWLDTFTKRLLATGSLSDSVKDDLLCFLIDRFTPRSGVQMDPALANLIFSAASNMHAYIKGEHLPNTDKKLLDFLSKGSRDLVFGSQKGGRWDLLVASQKSVGQILDDDPWLLDPVSGQAIWEAHEDWKVRSQLYRIHPEAFASQILHDVFLPDGSLNETLIGSGVLSAAEVEAAMSAALELCRFGAVPLDYQTSVAKAAAIWIRGVLLEQGDLSKDFIDRLLGIPAFRAVFGRTHALVFAGTALARIDQLLIEELLKTEEDTEASQKVGLFAFVLQNGSFGNSLREQAFKGLSRAKVLNGFVAGWHRGIKDNRVLHPIDMETFYDWISRLLTIGKMEMPNDHVTFLLFDLPADAERIFAKYQEFKAVEQGQSKGPVQVNMSSRIDLSLYYDQFRICKGHKGDGLIGYEEDWDDSFTGPWRWNAISERQDWIDWHEESKGEFTVQFTDYPADLGKIFKGVKEQIARAGRWADTYGCAVPRLFETLPLEPWALSTNLVMAMPHHRREAVLRQYDEKEKSSDQKQALAMMVELAGHAKLGQLMSIYLPVAWRDTFEHLQDQVSPSPQSTILSALKEQWGNKMPQVAFVDRGGLETAGFGDADLLIEYPPVKSGTIGEVLKAKFKDGRVVAIKVITPARIEAIATMMGEASEAARALQEMGVYAIDGLSVKDLVGQYIETMKTEVDFRKELEGARRIGALPRGMAKPVYQQELCTQGVLVMDWIEGVKVTDKGLTEKDKKRVSNLLPQLITKAFTDLSMQADPHPGNLMFLHDTNTLVVLDFGQTITFKIGFMDNLVSFLIAYGMGDAMGMAKALDALSGTLSEKEDYWKKPVVDHKALATQIKGYLAATENSALSLLGEGSRVLGLFRLMGPFGCVVDGEAYQFIKALGMIEKTLTDLAKSLGKTYDMRLDMMQAIQSFYQTHYMSTPKGLMRRDLWETAEKERLEQEKKKASWPYYVKFASLDDQKALGVDESEQTGEAEATQALPLSVAGSVQPAVLVPLYYPILSADLEDIGFAGLRNSEEQRLVEAFLDPKVPLVLLSQTELWHDVRNLGQKVIQQQVLEKGQRCFCYKAYASYTLPNDFADVLARMDTPYAFIKISADYDPAKNQAMMASLAKVVEAVSKTRPDIKVLVVWEKGNETEKDPEACEQGLVEAGLSGQGKGLYRRIGLDTKPLNFAQFCDIFITRAVERRHAGSYLTTIPQALALASLVFENLPAIPFMIETFLISMQFEQDVETNLVDLQESLRAYCKDRGWAYRLDYDKEAGVIRFMRNFDKTPLFGFGDGIFKITREQLLARAKEIEARLPKVSEEAIVPEATESPTPSTQPEDQVVLQPRPAVAEQPREWPEFVQIVSPQNEDGWKIDLPWVRQKAQRELTVPVSAMGDIKPLGGRALYYPLQPVDPIDRNFGELRKAEEQQLAEAFNDPKTHLIFLSQIDAPYHVSNLEFKAMRNHVLAKGRSFFYFNTKFHDSLPRDFAGVLAALDEPYALIVLEPVGERSEAQCKDKLKDTARIVEEVSKTRPDLKVLVAWNKKAETQQDPNAFERALVETGLTETGKTLYRRIGLDTKPLNFAQFCDVFVKSALERVSEENRLMSDTEALALAAVIFENLPAIPLLLVAGRVRMEFDKDIETNLAQILKSLELIVNGTMNQMHYLVPDKVVGTIRVLQKSDNKPLFEFDDGIFEITREQVVARARDLEARLQAGSGQEADAVATQTTAADEPINGFVPLAVRYVPGNGFAGLFG